MTLFQGSKTRLVVYLQICCSGLLLFALFPNIVFADLCGRASADLQASFEVTQGRGGIWGYMEKISSLQKDSMIGFQVDGKLQRIIVIFQTQCAKTNKPSRANFDKIMNVLGDARMLFNLRPGRNPIKEIRAKINELNTHLDKLIKELES